MKSSSLIALSLVGVVALAVLALPACNSNPPVAPGNVSNFQPSPPTATPTPCASGSIFGNNTIGASNTANNDLFFYPQVASSTTTLEKLSIYTTSAGAVTFEAGVYSNNAGQPGSLLAETGPQTITAAATVWTTVFLQSYVSLSAGVTYWLAYPASPAASARDNTATIAYCYQPAGVFGALAPSFSNTGNVSSGYTFSVYGTTCP